VKLPVLYYLIAVIFVAGLCRKAHKALLNHADAWLKAVQQ
jgi:hypothetical protein